MGLGTEHTSISDDVMNVAQVKVYMLWMMSQCVGKWHVLLQNL